MTSQHSDHRYLLTLLFANNCRLYQRLITWLNALT
jgi:hypothetical protein